VSRAPALYLVADRGFLGTDAAWLERLGEVAEALAGLPDDVIGDDDNGVTFQLRVKGPLASDRRRLLTAGLERARASDAPVVLNGREDEARQMGFDGVHWPEDLVPPAADPAGAASDRRFVRGASVHSMEAARRAMTAGADFLVFGPVYAPGSKPGAGVGIGALEEIVQGTGVPVLAIGGLTARRARACRAAGAWGVAVVSAVFSPEIPAVAAVRELLDAVR